MKKNTDKLLLFHMDLRGYQDSQLEGWYEVNDIKFL